MSPLRSVKPALIAAALLGGCGGRAAEPVVTPTPRFDPTTFFAGRTKGEGQLKILLKATQAVHVQGEGRVDRDGTLVLDQIVQRGDRKPDRRQWRMRAVGPNHYRGTLTDAVGPVDIRTKGSLLTIRYDAKGGVTIAQSLYLDASGRTALNRMTVTKFGIAVAHLTETIRKLD